MTAPKTDALVALLIALACFLPEVGLFGDGALLPKWYMALLASCLLMLKAAVGGVDRRAAWAGLRWGILASSLVVCCWTLTDAISNVHWPVRGTYDNPAGLALSLCCAMALLMDTSFPLQGKRRWLVFSLYALFSLTIIATQSRIGIAVLGIILLLFFQRRGKRRLAALALIAMASVFVVLMNMKGDSTSGRHFILQRTCEMIEERPLAGWGIGGFRRHYMLHQAAYFSSHTDNDAAWLADDVRHPFCEYLLWWVDGGVVGLFLCLVFFLLPIFRSRKTVLRNISLVVSLFALASYPLHYPVSWLFLGLGWYTVFSGWMHERRLFQILRILCITGCTIVMVSTSIHAYSAYRLRQAERAAEQHRHHYAIHLYEQLIRVNSYNPYFLYSFSRECYTVGRFSEALRLNNECHRYWNTYDLTLLRADIFFQRQDYSKAISNYRLAHNMCPVRFAPLDGLLNTYEAIEDTAKMRQIALQIIGKPIKVPSQTVNQIKSKAREIMNNDSLFQTQSHDINTKAHRAKDISRGVLNVFLSTINDRRGVRGDVAAQEYIQR